MGWGGGVRGTAADNPLHLGLFWVPCSSVRERKHSDRQKKRWEDNIREWTGLEFAKPQRAVENREK